MKTGQAKDISSWDSVIRILCGYYSETRLVVPRPCCTLEPLGELIRHFRSLEILINNLSPAGPSVCLLETADNSNANLQLRTTEPDHVCYIRFISIFQTLPCIWITCEFCSSTDLDSVGPVSVLKSPHFLKSSKRGHGGWLDLLCPVRTRVAVFVHYF